MHNRNPHIRFKKLAGQLSHFGKRIAYDTLTPEFIPLLNGGFIALDIANQRVRKCFTVLCQEYHQHPYVDDQAFIRKHLYNQHIMPCYLDSRVGL